MTNLTHLYLFHILSFQNHCWKAFEHKKGKKSIIVFIDHQKVKIF